MSSVNHGLVPLRSRAISHDVSIVGEHFFYQNELVQAVGFQNSPEGDHQVAIRSPDGYISLGVVSIHELTAAGEPTESELTSERCDQLQQRIEALEEQNRDLLAKYESLIQSLTRRTEDYVFGSSCQ